MANGNPWLRAIRGIVRRPKLVLFAWELGGGLGHIHRLLPVATELSRRGHRIVFALRDRDHSSVIEAALPGTKIVLAPIYWPDPDQVRPKSGSNYADVLHRCGFDSPHHLGPVVKQWRDLLQSLNPALIVCDHSPTVVLAAANRVPTIHIGSGFANPPAGKPFLTFFPKAADGAKDREAEVLATLEELHTYIDTPALGRVCDLPGLAESFACCLPELDPYRDVRAEPALGPMEPLPEPRPLPYEGRIFGYFDGDDHRTGFLLQSLAKAEVQVAAYIRKCPAEWRTAADGTSVTLFSEPQRIGDAVGRARAVVHHAGLATTETGLAIGRPQFLFPRNVEQILTADAVEQLGCGVNLARHGDPGDAIRRALLRGTYMKEAAVVAAKIAARPAVDVRSEVVRCCEKHLWS